MTALFRRVRSPQSTLVGIVLLAAFLRLYRLDSLPPGMHFDVAFNYFDIFRLLRGDFEIFFPANNGREPFYFYLSLVSVALFNDGVLAERLTSAAIGIATIPVIYWLGRSLFHSTRIALLASFFLAISVWHIYYSRYGLRVILAVLLTALAIGYFWRGISFFGSVAKVERGSVWSEYARAGLFLSLALYTYTSSRFVPLVLVAITLCALGLDRTRARGYIAGLATTALVAAALFVPLALYFLSNPEQFSAHSTNLSLLDPRVNKGDLFGTLSQNIVTVGGMFLVRGDHEIFRNIANRPVFDLLTGALFLAGILLLLRDTFAQKATQHARLRALLLAASLLILVAPSALSDDPPNFTRTLPAVSFAVLLAAWGTAKIWERISSRRFAGIALGLVLALTCFISIRRYFLDFATSPALYAAFDADKIDAARWIVDELNSQIYMAPLWAQDGTFALYTRKTTLKSFESRDTIVLPSRAGDKDAVIAFPLEQERKAATLGERLGSLATREMVRGTNDGDILIAYRVRADKLPDPKDPLAVLQGAGVFAQPQTRLHATWANALELLGYTINAADEPKRNLEVTVFLHSLNSISDDFTFSIKARDGHDRAWGQEDKWLGDNSYSTTQMGVGDLVIEKFYPGLNPCAPAGDYRVSLEIYNPKTAQVAMLADGSSAATLGIWRTASSLGNLYENLEPAESVDLDVAPETRLFGFTLTPDEVHADDEFSLSLFFSGSGDGKTARHVSVRLQNTILAEREILLPPEGRGLCSLFDLRAPVNIAPGSRALFVNDIKIGTLSVK